MTKNIRCFALFLVISLIFGCSARKQEPVADVSSVSPMMDADMPSDETIYPVDQPPQIKFKNIEDSLSVRIIYFEYDSSRIQREQQPVVEAHGQYLATNSDTRVVLEGHADERGSREYNLALGERRAISVRNQMVLMGADEKQIRVVSYGEERPAIDEQSEEAWQQNRRVEILY